MTWIGTLVGMWGWRSIRSGMHVIKLKPPRNIPRMVTAGTASQRSLWCYPSELLTTQTNHIATATTKPTSTYPRGFWDWRGGDDKKWKFSEGGISDSTANANANANAMDADPSSSTTRVTNKLNSVCTAQGYRSYMEDEFFLSKNGDFAAVFDGHGGAAVSRYLRKNLYANVQAYLPVVTPASTTTSTSTSTSTTSTTIGIDDIDGKWTESNDNANNQTQTQTQTQPQNSKRVSNTPSVQEYEHALESALQKVDREVQRISHWSYQGSTAVAIWLHEEKVVDDETTTTTNKESTKLQRTIIAANVGDSRAVLCRNGTAWDLTRDHKPNDPYEQARIEELGGEVVWCGDTDDNGDPIMERGIYRVNGNLALSRAIGDRSERPHVTADPEIISALIQEGDEFIVVASDGLWDVFDSDDAVNFVRSLRAEGHHHDKLATLMTEEALRRGTYDNITVVIIWLDRNAVAKS